MIRLMKHGLWLNQERLGWVVLPPYLGMCIKKKLITESKKYYLRNQQQIN